MPSRKAGGSAKKQSFDRGKQIYGIKSSAPKYVDDGSWKILKDEGGRLQVKGMLKISVKPDDLNLYLVQLSNGESLEVRTGFGTVHNLRIDACVGSVVELEGDYKVKDGRKVITRVKRCKRL